VKIKIIFGTYFALIDYNFMITYPNLVCFA